MLKLIRCPFAAKVARPVAGFLVAYLTGLAEVSICVRVKHVVCADQSPQHPGSWLEGAALCIGIPLTELLREKRQFSGRKPLSDNARCGSDIRPD